MKIHLFLDRNISCEIARKKDKRLLKIFGTLRTSRKIEKLLLFLLSLTLLSVSLSLSSSLLMSWLLASSLPSSLPLLFYC